MKAVSNRAVPIRRAVRALLAIAVSIPCASAADSWTRLNSPHFELYTTASEKKGRELILCFEQIRSFFAQASPVKGVTEFPVRIVVFRSEKQYRPYAPNQSADAFYTQGRYRDYIVLGDADPEHLPGAVHEFMHLVVNHSGLKLPVWLNEGWADLYSTLKPMGKKAMVGDLIPGRVQTLQTGKWLSFDELTSVGLNSATYNEKDRAGVFYAESWALVHMLYLAPEYSPKFAAFVGAVHRGKTSAEACQIAYGRTPAKVYADLQMYLKRNQLFGAVFDVKLTASEEQAEASQPSAFESDTMLADLLSMAGKKELAAEAFRKLAAEHPGKPEIAQSMGYLAWQNGDRAAARQEFAKAFAAGGNDPQMCFHFAMLELEDRQPDDDKARDLAVAALRRAVGVKRDYTDAWLQLGFTLSNAHDYPGALSALQNIHKIDDDHAADLFNALAYAWMQSGNLGEARKQAELALKWDKTDFDKQRTQNMLKYLDSRAGAAAASPAAETPKAPPSSRLTEKLERVEGTAKALDCEKKRFVIESGGRTLAFDMPDPNAVLLRHNGSATVEFACGPQKPFRVVVEFSPSGKDTSGKDTSGKDNGDTRGRLRTLEF